MPVTDGNQRPGPTYSVARAERVTRRTIPAVASVRPVHICLVSAARSPGCLMRSSLLVVRRVAVASLLLPALAAAQDGYRQPPEPIRSILDATPTPRVAVSPDNSQLLLLDRPSLPGIAEVAAPYVAMAGQRLNPNTNFPSRAATSTGLTIMAIATSVTRTVSLPAGVKVGNVRWSPDGMRAAFPMITDQGAGLGVLDVASGLVSRVGTVRVNGAFGDPCLWMPSSDALLCKTIPASRGAAPQAPAAPGGPVAQESFGRKSPERTYQDLLTDGTDDARFTYFGTSQIAVAESKIPPPLRIRAGCFQSSL